MNSDGLETLVPPLTRLPLIVETGLNIDVDQVMSRTNAGLSRILLATAYITDTITNIGSSEGS